MPSPSEDPRQEATHQIAQRKSRGGNHSGWPLAGPPYIKLLQRRSHDRVSKTAELKEDAKVGKRHARTISRSLAERQHLGVHKVLDVPIECWTDLP